MIRKPTSGDSEQRKHEAEKARKSSELHAGSSSTRPSHGSSEGESAHGALPRHGIEDEQGE